MSRTSSPTSRSAAASQDVVLHIGRDELVIRQRYEVVSIVNDVLIGLWFLVGSFLFFSDSLVFWGTWMFVAGSVEMLIRPVIRLVRHLHLGRYHPSVVSAAAGSQDY